MKIAPFIPALLAALLALIGTSNAQDAPIVTTLANTTGFRTFSALLESFPLLTRALNDPGRNSTVFAPSDSAFSSVGGNLLLLNSTRPGRLLLFGIVEYHIHVGDIINLTELEVGTDVIVPTLAGFRPGSANSGLNLTLSKREVPGGGAVVYVNEDTVVTQPDIPASNGMIQGVSNLLDPFGSFPTVTSFPVSTIFPTATSVPTLTPTSASLPTLPATLSTTITISRPAPPPPPSTPSFTVGGPGRRLAKRVIILENQGIDYDAPVVEKKAVPRRQAIIGEMAGGRAI